MVDTAFKRLFIIFLVLLGVLSVLVLCLCILMNQQLPAVSVPGLLRGI